MKEPKTMKEIRKIRDKMYNDMKNLTPEQISALLDEDIKNFKSEIENRKKAKALKVNM